MSNVLKEQHQALAKVMRYLAQRDHSELELREKLRDHHCPDSIDWAIEESKQQGWLISPEELAIKVAEQLHRRLKGIIYIQKYLRKKGLPAVAIDPEREVEKCREVLLQKMNKSNSFSYEEKQKAFRYLSYRGFAHESIRRVIYEDE